MRRILLVPVRVRFLHKARQIRIFAFFQGFQRPNWLNARFAFMFVFFAVLFTYDAFRYLRETGVRRIGVTAMLSVVLLLVMQAMGYKNVDDFLTVWAGAVRLRKANSDPFQRRL